MLPNWFSKNRVAVVAGGTQPSAPDTLSGSATARHYPPPSHVVSPIEAVARAGQRLSGTCTICSAVGEFEPFNENLRESGACPQCRSSNRQRQMAWMLRRELGLAESSPLRIPDGVRVYNTEANGPLHEMLRTHAEYQCSEYWGDKAEFGEVVDGTRNEDLQALSFASASFDVVLSSDVLEHMPQPYRAHSEIHRVLKPGGQHIFTVPYGEAMIRDNVRASLIDGKVMHHHEPLYHGDPVRPGEGILVWTIFGLEMLVRLNEIGFDTELWRLQEPGAGIIGPGADVFIARKP
jgi:SAM-dependent methyltransferase